MGKRETGSAKNNNNRLLTLECVTEQKLTVLYFVHIINDTLFLNCASTIVPVKYHLFC